MGEAVGVGTPYPAATFLPTLRLQPIPIMGKDRDVSRTPEELEIIDAPPDSGIYPWDKYPMLDAADGATGAKRGIAVIHG